MLSTCDVLNQGGAYNVICCENVDKEGLVDIRLMEDRWRCKGGFEVLEDLLTFVIPRELHEFLE